MITNTISKAVPWNIKTEPYASRNLNKRIHSTLILAGLVAFWLLVLQQYPLPLTSASLFSSSRSPYAYVTLLAQNPSLDNASLPDSEDTYYVATRTLLHQMLHAPSTATNSSIPFVVLATPDIASHKIERLRLDGAIVHVVDRITADWLAPGLPRWRDMMCKLHMFKLVEYEKVLFMDSDMLIVDRMDGIFTDATTNPFAVDQSRALPDESALPDTYMLAAQSYLEGRTHPYPPNTAPGFSGGFLVAQPSKRLFDYYISLIAIEGRFRSNAMEQDLLNYAHRRDGPMPWAKVRYTYTTTWPSWKEYEMGAKSLHEKWWDVGIDLDWRLRGKWFEAKGEMEGYWRGREGVGKGLR